MQLPPWVHALWEELRPSVTTGPEGPASSTSPAPATNAGETAVDKKPVAVEAANWADATKRVRDVSDWIVKAFVALATLLVGTGPLLIHLADLKADYRGGLAVAGALLALVGVGVVVWLASSVNLTETTDMVELVSATSGAVYDLRRRMEGTRVAQEFYLAGRPTVDALIEARRRAIAARASQTPLNPPSTPEVAAEFKRLAALSSANIEHLDAILAALLDRATYDTVRERFDRSRPKMFAAAMATALGVAVWLGALGIDVGAKAGVGESTASASSSVTPSPGSVVKFTWHASGGMDKEAIDVLRNQLAANDDNMSQTSCASFGALLEGGTGSADDPWQLAVLPNDLCPVRLRFAIDRRFGILQGFQSSESLEAKVKITNEKTWWPGIVWSVVGGLLVGALMAFWITGSVTRRSRRQHVGRGR